MEEAAEAQAWQLSVSESFHWYARRNILKLPRISIIDKLSIKDNNWGEMNCHIDLNL